MNNKVNKLKEQYSKEYLIELYITQNKTKQELAEIFNVGLSTIASLLKDLDIVKSKSAIVSKRKSTCLERYGVDNPSKSNIVKDKIKTVNQARYGANSFTATAEGKLKVKETKAQRYGDCNYNNCSKQHLTKMLKYNDSAYNNRDKYKNTMMDKYGVDNYFRLSKSIEDNLDKLVIRKEYNPIFRSLINNRETSIEYLKDHNYTYFDLNKLLNVPYYSISQWVNRLELHEYINYTFTGKSHYENEIIEFLKSIGVNNIIQSDRSILNDQEIDIYLPEFNLGIEFNGTYWHSDLFKDINYHLNKSIQAESKGVRLIHVYQYEWDDTLTQDKIKNIIRIACHKTSNTIYARNCDIKKVNNKDAKLFNDTYHLQNHRIAKVTYGLYYNNELVQLMSFSSSKYNKNITDDNSWEIIRECSKSNLNIVGGSSKLLTHFIKDYNPSNVFSYCDFNKYNGNGYLKLGMKFIGNTRPDLKYIINDKVINRQPNKYKEIKEYIDMRLYGAGSKKFKLSL